jgi:hypothetical protein
MAESRKLNTITQVVKNSDGTVAITVRYVANPGPDQLPNTLSGFVGDGIGRLADIQYIEGDLILLVKNYPQNINYAIDNNGDLILFCNTGDINNYYIDEETGDLMWGPNELQGVDYWIIENTFIVS